MLPGYSPLEVAASVAAFVTFSSKLYQTSRAARTQKNAQRDLLVRNYGRRIGNVVSVILPDTAMHYYKIQTDILDGMDEDAAAFR